MESGQQQAKVQQGSRFGSRSRQYLTAMGIDIWQTRVARSVKDPASLTEESAENTETLQKVAVAAATSGQPSRTNAASLDQKNSRESLLKQVSANVEPETPLSDVVERQLRQEQPVTQQASARLEFLLYFMNYDSFTIVFALPYATAELPPTYKNFLEGVSLSLARERVAPSIRQLRWPIVKASHIDQSEHEARQIVRDSLRQSQGQSQRQSQEPPEGLSPVLVFGEEAWRYLVTDSEKTVFHIGDTEQEASCLFLALPTIDDISQDVALKRQLWRQLSPVRAILYG